MPNIFTVTTFDEAEKKGQLQQRAEALNRICEFEACVTRWMLRTSRMDGPHAARRVIAEKAAERELGYRM